jgi:hypothetical protein
MSFLATSRESLPQAAAPSFAPECLLQLHRILQRHLDQSSDRFREVGLRGHQVVLHRNLGGIPQPGRDDMDRVFRR